MTLLLAATATSAFPTELTKRLDTIPLNFYSGAGCNTGTAVTTVYIPTDGSCFSTSPIFSGNTDSALILPLNLASLPAGCSGKFFLSKWRWKSEGKRIGWEKEKGEKEANMGTV
jgi:hypothetical protein